MIHNPLQINIDPKQVEELQHKADSIQGATQEFLRIMQEDPTTAWTQLGRDALEFGLKVVAALLIYVVGIWLTRKIKHLMNRSFEKKGTDKTIASFANSCVSITLTVLVIILCISTLGINTTSLAALLAAGGMAIGMALSGTLQNFAGGIILLMFKPFKAGDYVEAQGYAGTVSEVNIFSTKITTLNNEAIIIPNGALSGGTIKNYSAMPCRRYDFTVPFEHGTDMQAAMDTLLEVASKDERVLKGGEFPDAAPAAAMVDSIDMHGVTIVMKAWTKSDVYWDFIYDYRLKAYSAILEKGFKIATPKVNIEQ